MIDIQLKVGELWEIDGERHYFEQLMGSGLLLFRSERTSSPYQVQLKDGVLASPTMSWFKGQVMTGGVRRIDDPHATAARGIANGREDDFDAIQGRDPRARIRQIVLTSLDRMRQFSRSDPGLRRALADIWAAKPLQLGEHKPPAPSTVRGWLNSRGNTGERRLRSMVCMSGRVPRAKRLPRSVHRYVHGCAMAYWSDHSTTIGDAYDELITRLSRINRWLAARRHSPLPIPSKETFRSHVRRTECWETVAAKFGRKEADRRFKACGRGLVAHRPLLLGAMDHTVLDCHIVIDANGWRLLGRPTLTLLIDVHSRCVLGWVLSFEPPSLYGVMECIKRANRPKLQLLDRFPDHPELSDIFGKFDEIVVDNGWEFTGTSFEAAMTDIGTTVRWAPTRSPTYKAVVERFFGTLNTKLNRKLPGGTFPPAQLRAWELDPRKDAVLTLSQAEKLIWGAISTYHLERHRGLGDRPARAWIEGVRECGIQVISDERQLEKMAGAHQTRTLSRSGISLFNLQYHDPAVTGPLLEKLVASTPMRGRRMGSAKAKVTVKYNPANLGEIHVWDPPAGLYVTLPCVEPDYAEGLTLWRHQRIAEWKGERAKAEGLEEAERRVALRRQIEAASSEELIGRKRRATARLLSSPQLEQIAGSHVRVAYTAPRHDGMAPVVPNNPLAPSRTDDAPTPVRPPRSTRRTKGVRIERPNRAGIEPQTGSYPTFDDVSEDWEEFR